MQSLVETGRLEGERGAYRLVDPVERLAVPATVQAVLAARIDRLPEREKRVLQAASVIGKEFSEPVAGAGRRAAPRRSSKAALRSLARAEFLYEQALYPEAEYAFKHPLTQEVALGSSCASDGRQVHAAVARAIERAVRRAPRRARRAAGASLGGGRRGTQAARWHARAAEWSGYNDPTQALPHWGKVRELADTLPESAEILALGLTARTSLLNYGWRLGTRARRPRRCSMKRRDGLAGGRHPVADRRALDVRGDHRPQLRRHPRVPQDRERAFELTEESDDPSLTVALAPTAYAYSLTGEDAECIALMDRAVELAQGDPTVGAGMPFGCPYAWCHGFKGYLLAERGELEVARRLIEQGRELARAQGDTETVGWSHLWSTALAYFQGEPESALTHAKQALEIAERMGGSFSRAHAWLWFGVAERMCADWPASVEAIERAVAIATMAARPERPKAGASPARRVIPRPGRCGAGGRARREGPRDRSRTWSGPRRRTRARWRWAGYCSPRAVPPGARRSRGRSPGRSRSRAGGTRRSSSRSCASSSPSWHARAATKRRVGKSSARPTASSRISVRPATPSAWRSSSSDARAIETGAGIEPDVRPEAERRRRGWALSGSNATENREPALDRRTRQRTRLSS